MCRSRLSLSERERTILTFIQKYCEQEGIAPTVREIGSGCYLAPSVVFYHLEKLEDKGYLTRKPGSPRSLRLLPKPMPKI